MRYGVEIGSSCLCHCCSDHRFDCFNRSRHFPGHFHQKKEEQPPGKGGAQGEAHCRHALVNDFFGFFGVFLRFLVLLGLVVVFSGFGWGLLVLLVFLLIFGLFVSFFGFFDGFSGFD